MSKITSLFFIFFLLIAVADAKDIPPTEKAKIRTEEAILDLEKDQYSIPGDAEIESGELTIKGAGLVYDRKKGTVQFQKSPVKLSYGKNLRAVLGAVNADLNTRFIHASEGCVVEFENEDMFTRMEASDITLDLKNKIAEAATNTVFHYQAKAKKTKMGVDVSEMSFSASKIRYNFGEGKAAADGEAKVEFRQGYLRAAKLEADLEEKIVRAENVEVQIEDIHAHAGKVMLYYGEERAVLEGGVEAERGEEKMKADGIIINYRKGQKSMHLVGKGELDLVIKKEEKPVEEKKLQENNK